MKAVILDSTLGGSFIGYSDTEASGIDHFIEFRGYATHHFQVELDNVLRASGNRLRDLDAVIVSTGPGSFTGIKIGIAFAQGLRRGAAGAIKVAGFSSLECLAKHSQEDRGIWILKATNHQGYVVVKDGDVLRSVIVDLLPKPRFLEAHGRSEVGIRLDDYPCYLLSQWPEFQRRFDGQQVVYEGERLGLLSLQTMAAQLKAMQENLGDFPLRANYIRYSAPQEKLLTGEPNGTKNPH
jgi:hypothetical protein